ncbi:lipopolysaccharide biosynthesis protein [Zhenpiania hominis]|uniref:lipopolysaccharide biosynthesis protein n=1 Tax=Zhenpiania hominis TaxID=2763644 RepID=UPI0039F531A4
MNEKKNKVILNILTEFVGKGLVLIISVLLPKLYIDNYGSEYNGLLSSLNGIFVYLNLLEAGIGSASIQALYKPIVNRSFDRISHIISATKKMYFHNGVYFLGCLAIVAFLYPYYSHTEIQYLTVVILVFISAAPYILKFFFRGKYTVLLTADNRLYILNLIGNICHIVANIIKIIMLYQKMDIIVVQLVFGIASMVEILFIYLYIRRKYVAVNFNDIPDYQAISKSKSAMVHEFAYVIFSNSDILLLTYFCGLKIVSVYSVYNLIFSSLSQLLQSVTNGTNAALGQLMVENRNKYLRNYYRFEYLFQCLSCMVIISAGAVTREFVSIYTINANDVNYSIGGITILFVAIQIVSLVRWPGVGAIKYSGMFKETQGRALIEMTINLLLSLVLIHPFGIHGVLFATIVALIYRTADVIFFTEQKILHNSKGRRPLRIFLLMLFSACIFVIEYNVPFKTISYAFFLLHGTIIFVLNSFLFGVFYLSTRKMPI